MERKRMFFVGGLYQQPFHSKEEAVSAAVSQIFRNTEASSTSLDMAFKSFRKSGSFRGVHIRSGFYIQGDEGSFTPEFKVTRCEYVEPEWAGMEWKIGKPKAPSLEQAEKEIGKKNAHLFN